MGDDAHITFRTVWNFVHGYGLTYNPDERVQAYTHPLWMLAITAAHFVTREFFFTVTALSWVFDVAAGVVLLRRARTIGSRGAAGGVAIQLEGADRLHLVGARISTQLFPDRAVLRPISRRGRFEHADAARVAVFRAGGGAGIRQSHRHGPAVRRSAWRRWRSGASSCADVEDARRPSSSARCQRCCGSRLRRSTTASRCRTRITPRWPTGFRPGCSISKDGRICSTASATIRSRSRTIALALLLPAYARRRRRADSVGAALRRLHGVDRRRLHERPLLRDAVPGRGDDDGARHRRIARRRGGAALVLYNLLVPIVPIKTTATYDGAWPWRTQNGIKDERGHTHQGSNLLTFAPFRDTCPTRRSGARA